MMDTDKNVELHRLQLALDAERARSEMLELMLFTFVYNRTTYPAGKALGKTDEEILLKTLEVIGTGISIVDLEDARNRLCRAKELVKERSGYEWDKL